MPSYHSWTSIPPGKMGWNSSYYHEKVRNGWWLNVKCLCLMVPGNPSIKKYMSLWSFNITMDNGPFSSMVYRWRTVLKKLWCSTSQAIPNYQRVGGRLRWIHRQKNHLPTSISASHLIFEVVRRRPARRRWGRLGLVRRGRWGRLKISAKKQ
jgi:hypothetical protein